MSTETEPLAFNPFDPVYRADPYPFFERLRTEAPTGRVPGVDVWYVTRYDDRGDPAPSGRRQRLHQVAGLPAAGGKWRIKAAADHHRPAVFPVPGPAGPHPAAQAGVQGLHPQGGRADAATDRRGGRRAARRGDAERADGVGLGHRLSAGFPGHERHDRRTARRPGQVSGLVQGHVRVDGHAPGRAAGRDRPAGKDHARRQGLPDRTDQRAPPPALRRLDLRADPGGGGRWPAQPGRADVDHGASGRRRHGDHRAPDLQRDPRAAAASGPAGAAAPRPVVDRTGDRREPAMGSADPAHPADGADRLEGPGRGHPGRLPGGAGDRGRQPGRRALAGPGPGAVRRHPADPAQPVLLARPAFLPRTGVGAGRGPDHHRQDHRTLPGAADRR